MLYYTTDKSPFTTTTLRTHTHTHACVVQHTACVVQHTCTVHHVRGIYSCTKPCRQESNDIVTNSPCVSLRLPPSDWSRRCRPCMEPHFPYLRPVRARLQVVAHFLQTHTTAPVETENNVTTCMLHAV